MVTKKLWIDTDAGVDDAQAILMALSYPDVEVIGITTVHGNASVGQVAKNVLRILKVADRLDVSCAIWLPPTKFSIFFVSKGGGGLIRHGAIT